MLTKSKGQIIWGVCLFLLILFSINKFVIGGLANLIQISKAASVLDISEPSVRGKNIRLGFVGDIMLDRGVEKSVYNNFGGDYSRLFEKVNNQLESFDVLSGNLEGPVSRGGVDKGALYSFKMEPEVIPILKSIGINVLSVANNHIFNWGPKAFADTLQLLSDNSIVYPGGGLNGAEAYQEKVIDVEGIKVAFLAFSESLDGVITSKATKPGIAGILEKEIMASVSSAKLNNDLVVVLYHFGDEYEYQPNDYQKKYAELAIDFGADLVVGNHPHVIQDLERYKNSHIIYSLGNFIFDQNFSPDTMQGGLLEVEVNPVSKQITSAVLKKVQLNKLFQIESIE